MVKPCPRARHGVYFGIVISVRDFAESGRHPLRVGDTDPKAHRQTLPYVLGAGPAPGGEGHGEVQGAARRQHLLPLERGVEPVRRDAALPLPEGLRRDRGQGCRATPTEVAVLQPTLEITEFRDV